MRTYRPNFQRPPYNEISWYLLIANGHGLLLASFDSFFLYWIVTWVSGSILQIEPDTNLNPIAFHPLQSLYLIFNQYVPGEI